MVNSSLDALLTKRYGQWKRPIADPDTFTASLDFVPSSDRSGKDFTMPILTAISQGVTYDNTGGIVTLSGARPGVNSQAVLDGVNVYIQEQLAYSDLMKMANGDSMNGDAAAYESGPDWTMFSMRLGLKHHSEMMSLFGAGTGAALGSDIGVVNAVASGTNISGAGVIINLQTATWAKLLWLNSGSAGNANAGMLVDIYNAAGNTLLANKVRVTGVADSTKCQIGLVATAGTTTGPTLVPASGNRLIPSGWFGASALGVSGIMQNVGSFAGIDNTVIPQWRPQTYDCAGAAMSTDLLQNFAGKLLGNGFKKGVFDVWACPAVMSVLINQFSPYSRWQDGAGRDKKNIGTGALSIDTPVGNLNLRPYGYCKQGEVLVIAKGEAVRIGATENREDGIQGTGLAFELPTQAGSEMRAMCQYAPLLTTPFWSGRMFNYAMTAAGGFDIQG